MASLTKLMVYAHPDDDPGVAAVQWARVAQLAQAAVAADRRYLVEFQSPAGVASGPNYLPRILTLAYEHGISRLVEAATDR